MSTRRTGHAATLLPDGKVLISGGTNSEGLPESSAEIFDSSGDEGVGSFTATESMTIARTEHTVTPLLDGRVLMSGGFTPEGVTASAEIFDPAGNDGEGTFAPPGA